MADSEVADCESGLAGESERGVELLLFQLFQELFDAFGL